MMHKSLQHHKYDQRLNDYKYKHKYTRGSAYNMAVSIYQQGYNKVSQIAFEWRAARKASLLALFITIEIVTHWLWCFMVWCRHDAVDDYVHMHFLYPLWLGVTFAGLFFWWLRAHLACSKNQGGHLYQWQIVLITVYTLYITVVIIMMDYSSLFAGVTLVGCAMLGMMLIRRRYVWYMFLAQILLILMAVISPYFGIALPNLRQLMISYPMFDTFSYLNYNEIMVIENTIAASIFKHESLDWDSFYQIQHSSTFFWRVTHIYLALPKAFLIVYAFRTLLVVLDDSKKEILQHANQDELTMLDNRRYGLTKMQLLLQSTVDTQDNSIILLDLDLFKGVNDRYGHDVGDQVLKDVAQVLRETLTTTDIVSRYGGEEFLIILPDTAHDRAMIMAEKLRRNISLKQITVADSLSFSVTASLGLYTLTSTALACMTQECTLTLPISVPQKPNKRQLFGSLHGEEGEEANLRQLHSDICQRLICIADKALYVAKASGRNQVVSANESS